MNRKQKVAIVVGVVVAAGLMGCASAGAWPHAGHGGSTDLPEDSAGSVPRILEAMSAFDVEQEYDIRVTHRGHMFFSRKGLTDGAYVVEVLRDKEVLVTWAAHQDSSFALRGHVFYRADYCRHAPLASGAAHLDATDLRTGRRLWRVPVPHHPSDRDWGSFYSVVVRVFARKGTRTLLVQTDDHEGLTDWWLDADSGRVLTSQRRNAET